MTKFNKKIFITIEEALKSIAQDQSDVLVLEVMCDYYKNKSGDSTSNFSTDFKISRIFTEQIECDKLWNIRPDDDLQNVLSEYGLRPDSTKRVFLFDNIEYLCGDKKCYFAASARLFSVLHYFGFSKVSIIIGSNIKANLQTRLANKQLIENHELKYNGKNKIIKKDDLILEYEKKWIPKNKNYLADYKTIRQMLDGKQGNYRLLDARSIDEYAGKCTGYSYISLAGKIPTAENIVNGEYQVSDRENYESVIKRLSRELDSKNIRYDDRIVWYCGTGWRASWMCALTQALGYKNIAVYDGGWNEWHKIHPEHGKEKPWRI